MNQDTTLETGAVADDNESAVDALFANVLDVDATDTDETDDDAIDGDNVGGAMDKFEADDVDAADAAKAGPDEEKRIFIMVTMQQDKELFDKIDSDAKAEGIGRAAMARILLAKAYNYTLNEPDGRKAHKKYATEEEKVAARKAAQKTRAEEAKLLKEQHKLRQSIKMMKATGRTLDTDTEMQTLTKRIDEIDDLLA